MQQCHTRSLLIAYPESWLLMAKHLDWLSAAIFLDLPNFAQADVLIRDLSNLDDHLPV